MEPLTQDILIVGGGLVGASLACALHGSGLRVALVEASAGGQSAHPPSFDERNLALARASCNALTALGVWRHLASPPSPIERIHVSSRGDFGALRLVAAERGLDTFGAVVIARELGAALEARLDQLHDLGRWRATRVTDLQTHPDRIVARLERDGVSQIVATRLLVAADGTESGLRAQLGIAVERHDYEQTLFVATVQPERAHAQTAYERFTKTGPVALLPRAEGLCGSICTVARADAAQVRAFTDAQYRELLQRRFGWRLGRFGRVGRRSDYALQRVVAERLIAPRAVLVGNAAQTIHPIGAQGFKLGLRDALILAEAAIAAQRVHADPGAVAVLEGYAQRRRADREATLAFSDGLVRLFANRFAPLRMMRSLGMLALQAVPGLNDGLVAGAMGFRGETPALAFSTHSESPG
jgi:2-octaprenyl-6-methoxyphenol hydroxylase